MSISTDLTGDFYFCVLSTKPPPLFRNVCIYADWLGGGRLVDKTQKQIKTNRQV